MEKKQQQQQEKSNTKANKNIAIVVGISHTGVFFHMLLSVTVYTVIINTHS